ncbi:MULTISPECIES: hypothetical protein [Actinomadura]|uniref:Uncharacterized protein n=1 Tax=Actinomadura litoris TaxID=2678616 RepID=A0A7K1L5E0_9ACTN|nr:MULTISPECIES: hypothetical protein [Actinomadura]MBT2212660.1 hypothetical protein [Actinomadura sp. NEAU-AAG7]MUN39637.1 hypothetical protein [Actinomadura litoris]
MTRQITPGFSVLSLENRIAVLERQVALLTEAATLMAAALEGTPLDPPSDGGAEPAPLRRARELLLLPPLRSGAHR